MEEITIRFAEYGDIPKIMQYIDEHWKKDHILSKERTLFEWQYMNYDKLNFVIGINKNDKIYGILGFIPYAEDIEKDIALALWKAIPCKGHTFLGLELFDFLIDNQDYRCLLCTGINMKTTSKIYQYLGMKIGVMKQWYRLRRLNKYHIAKIEDDSIPEVENREEFTIWTCGGFDELEKNFDFDAYRRGGCKPYKSKSYLKKRYFSHPVYDYKVFRVVNSIDITIAILVLRVQECNSYRAVRFVDFIGDISYIKFLTQNLDDILLKYDAEYIDMYEAGIQENILISGGWMPVETSENIIPNYFAPYEQCNVNIYYCTDDAKVILFRGDGDQDRPN